jgi:hypothetical protein
MENSALFTLDLLKTPASGRDLPDPVFLVFAIANAYNKMLKFS